MAYTKYKICPACGEHNLPSLLECRKCETDLTGIKVVDSAMELKEQEMQKGSGESPSGSGTSALVRICECGARNPSQARKCSECGEDISDIIPTMDMQEKSACSYQLQAVDSDYTVTIDEPVSIIGREATLKDYLSAKMYVSRQHAKLTIVCGKVLIENLSNTNRTFINNKAISCTEPTPLTDGDEIGLGGIEIGGNRQEQAAYFVFHEKI